MISICSASEFWMRTDHKHHSQLQLAGLCVYLAYALYISCIMYMLAFILNCCLKSVLVIVSVCSVYAWNMFIMMIFKHREIWDIVYTHIIKVCFNVDQHFLLLMISMCSECAENMLEHLMMLCCNDMENEDVIVMKWFILFTRSICPACAGCHVIYVYWNSTRYASTVTWKSWMGFKNFLVVLNPVQLFHVINFWTLLNFFQTPLSCNPLSADWSAYSPAFNIK